MKKLVLIFVVAGALPTSAQVAITPLQGMSFGQIEYSGRSSSNVGLATNGQVSYPSQLSGNGLGTPGQVQISGPTGTVISISCTTQATLTTTGGTSLTLGNLQVVVGTSGATTLAGGTPCNGLGNGVTQLTTSSSASENILLFGGQLQTSGVTLSGSSYSSSHSGGTPIMVRLVVI